MRYSIACIVTIAAALEQIDVKSFVVPHRDV
jgi:hypothetical protein